MPIPSLFKSAALSFALVATAPAFAQGAPLNAPAFDALVAQGPVADAATIAASPWASKIKQAGTLRLGGTQTSNLFSLLNEKDGRLRGFDAGLAQMLARYILGDAGKVQFTQVTSSTREQVLINNQVDVVLDDLALLLRTQALRQGVALDGLAFAGEPEDLTDLLESVPGSGLGLAIVADQVGLYGGVLQPNDAPDAVNGLRVQVRVPAG